MLGDQSEFRTTGLRLPEAGSSLLEYVTKLVGREGFWKLSLYPDAAEATAVFHSVAPRRHGYWRDGGSDGDDAAAVAARRAQGRVRRYCAAHRLNRLGTLTYRGDGCFDSKAVRADVGGFFRRLRRRMGDRAFPYLWTPEWHEAGHGLHAHFAVGQFVPRKHIAEAWPHGFVHIKLIGDLGYSATSLDQARVAARYLSKYVSKSLSEHVPGLHRYEVAERFAPKCEVHRGPTAERVLAWAIERMDRTYSYRSESSSWEGYRGPSAVFVSWT